MDARRFDALSRALHASPTRRATLRVVASLGLFGAGDLLDPDAIAAKKKKRGKKKKKGCTTECCPGIKECLGNDVCCGGVCVQCCTNQDCRGFNETCCPSGNCRRPDEECCGPNGSCPSGKHCCATGVCRECCGKQHCPEEGTKCCTNGFCTTPTEQCCTDEDCATDPHRRCCTFPNGATGCRECCEDQHCPAGERCFAPGVGNYCYPCLAPGANCTAPDGFCCSGVCEPSSPGSFFGKCAGAP